MHNARSDRSDTSSWHSEDRTIISIYYIASRNFWTFQENSKQSMCKVLFGRGLGRLRLPKYLSSARPSAASPRWDGRKRELRGTSPLALLDFDGALGQHGQR